MPDLRILALASLALAAYACTPARESRSYTPPSYVRTDAGLRAALQDELAAPLTSGHAAELIKNGRVFDVMAQDLADARQSIHIFMFIWRPSRPSDQLVEVITERARAGVQCRIMVEQITSPKFRKEIWPVLEDAGCDVRFYRPITQVAAGEMIERNHRKLVIVDGQVGVTGGFGIWRSWEGDGKRADEWRDDAIRIRGPVVNQMQAAFEADWVGSGGAPLPREVYAAAPLQSTLKAAFVASSSGEHSAAQKMTYLLIARAQERLWIANSYFVPSDQMIAALIDRARQGVDVRVLAPGQIHDVPPVLAGQRSTYERLVKGGVRIWEYVPSMMHSKTMLVDDRWVVVGSTNLDPFSLEQLEEGSVVLESAQLARELEAAFEEDFLHALAIRDPRPTVFQELSRRILWIFGRDL